MASQASLRTAGGGDAAKRVADLAAASKPTSDDVLYAMEEAKTAMLERTARGVDFEERPFAPYSENGPFYLYPAGRATGKTATQKSRAAKRLSRKTGGEVTAGGGIRFASYAAAKRAFGRASVDLFGLGGAPHMLHALVTRLRGALEGVLGIYGAEAERAEGHNEGIPGRLPRRRWLDVSSGDVKRFADTVIRRVERRVRGSGNF